MSIDSCRVHGSTNASKFQNALNQLRREKEFSLEILHVQLPKKCCSCFGAASFKRLNLDILREICLDLISSTISYRYDDETTKLVSTSSEKSRKKRMLKHDVSYNLKKQLDEYPDEISDQEYSDEEEENNGISQLSNRTIRPKFRSERTLPSCRLHRSRQTCPTIVRQHPIFNNFLHSSLQSANFIGVDNVNSLENRRIILLEQFKAIQVPDSCIVHNRQYLSRFNFALNLLRLKREFPKIVYRELPAICCSCGGRKGLHVIDPAILRKTCDEIQSNSAIQQISEERSGLLVLQYTPTLDSEARQVKIGQFIGRGGCNLRALQDQYNIRLNIIDESSCAALRKRLDIIRAEHGNNLDGIAISFNKRNQSVKSTITVEEIKQKLVEAWDAAKEDVPTEGWTTYRRRTPIRSRFGVHRRRFR